MVLPAVAAFSGLAGRLALRGAAAGAIIRAGRIVAGGARGAFRRITRQVRRLPTPLRAAAGIVAPAAAVELGARAVERVTRRDVPLFGAPREELLRMRMRKRKKAGLISRRGLKTINRAFRLARQLNRAQRKIARMATRAGVKRTRAARMFGSPGVITGREALQALRM